MNDNEGLAEAIDRIKELSQDAAGGWSLKNFDLPENLVPGMESLPLLVRSGDEPDYVAVKPLVDAWRTAPERRKGTAQVTTLRAFIDLVARHKDEGTALFAKTQWPGPMLTAVIDYHTLTNEPRFGQHRVEYKFPMTPEFSAWIAAQSRTFSQVEFAEFVEDHVADLAAPTDDERKALEPLFNKAKIALPSDLMELSRGLEINVESTIKQSVKLASGESNIIFETKHKDGKGQEVHVPGLFMVALRAFVDGEPVRLAARLRYKPKDGGITWTFALYRWEDALRVRVTADLEKARAELGLPSYEGSPEG